MNTELIFFFTSFHPYSPFACLRWNYYKQTYCTTDSLLIVPPPMKCSAIWHVDKWRRLMANKERHSFSPTRFGQKTNVFNQIYMFLRNIGCWKFANSWILPPSLPCENYILPGWFMDGTVWVLCLLCLVFFHLIERQVRERAVGAEEREEGEWLCVVAQIILKFKSTVVLVASQWIMQNNCLKKTHSCFQWSNSNISGKFACSVLSFSWDKMKDLWIPSPIYLPSRITQSLDNTGIQDPWVKGNSAMVLSWEGEIQLFLGGRKGWSMVWSSWATEWCGNLDPLVRKLGGGSGMWLGFHGTEDNQLHGTRKEVVKAEMVSF